MVEVDGKRGWARPPATNLYLAAIAALAAFTGIYVTFGRPDNADPRNAPGREEVQEGGKPGTAKLGTPRKEEYPPRRHQLLDAKREWDNTGVYAVTLAHWLTGRKCAARG